MNFPLKQKIPIILIAALMFWAVSAFVYWNAQFIIYIDWIWNFYYWIILVLIISLILTILLSLKFKTLNILIGASCILGIFTSFIYAYNHMSINLNSEKLPNEKYLIESIEDQKNASSYNYFIGKIKFKNIEYKIRTNIDNSCEEEIHAGDIIECNLRFSQPQDEQKSYCWQNGINSYAWADNIKKIQRNDFIGIIYSYRNHLIDTIRNFDWQEKSKAKQLISAIVCGQRIDLNSSELYDSFKNCGLAHLVAVSGAHLSLVIALLVLVLKKFKIKKWLIILIQSFFILVYLICAAIPISAIRAAVMTYIAIFSFFGKRRPAPLNAIAICIFVLIGLNPITSVSLSFVLSASSTLGIILFSRLFEYIINCLSNKIPKFINNALALTIASGICSQLISIAFFTQIPLIAPIANIIAAPLFGLLCGMGLVSCVFASIFKDVLPIITTILINVSYFISQCMCWIVEILSKIPFACIPAKLDLYFAILISTCLAFLLYKFWDKFKYIKSIFQKKIRVFGLCVITVCSIICLISFLPSSSQTQLIMLDVGQGDSIYLSSKGKNFLIDTGNQDNKLKDNFAQLGITHLDGVLITHPDDDHCGSLDVIENMIDVNNFYIAKDLLTCTDDNCKKLLKNINKIVNQESIIPLNVGDKINFGEIEMNVIWPDKYKDNGGNCDSLTVIANIDLNNDGSIESRALLCGDAEKEEISQMLKYNRIPKIDIYKCGHHGSKNALEQNLADSIKPKISLISVGEKNRYGHPASSTISLLEKSGSKIYRTDKSGTIYCNFDYGQINIRTEK